MEASIKDRVYAAAETISAERNPTVASVRSAAGVSNADATRYLKEWREEKQNAGSTIAATPPAFAEQALRLAGGLWAEASRMAAESHAALEREWREQTAHQEKEIAELGDDLDTSTAQHDAELRARDDRIADLEKAAAGSAATAADSVAALATARAEHEQALSALRAELSEARGANTALTTALEALIARIPDAPEAPTTKS